MPWHVPKITNKYYYISITKTNNYEKPNYFIINNNYD